VGKRRSQKSAGGAVAVVAEGAEVFESVVGWVAVDVVDLEVGCLSAVDAAVTVAFSCSGSCELPCACAACASVGSCVSAAAASSGGEQLAASVLAEVGVGHQVVVRLRWLWSSALHRLMVDVGTPSLWATSLSEFPYQAIGTSMCSRIPVWRGLRLVRSVEGFDGGDGAVGGVAVVVGGVCPEGAAVALSFPVDDA
jgi:hypothetical protein